MSDDTGIMVEIAYCMLSNLWSISNVHHVHEDYDTHSYFRSYNSSTVTSPFACNLCYDVFSVRTINTLIEARATPPVESRLNTERTRKVRGVYEGVAARSS